jgi:PPOX class probable F420-dependent enzyme
MRTMSRDEWLAFVNHGTRTGKLATVRADGSPHVAPVWFLVDTVDGVDFLVFNTATDTLKGKALRRDPRFALCVDTDEPPFSYVLLHAEAELSDDPEPKLRWATRIGARYMGADQGERFGRRNAVPGELLVRGRITKVVARADIAD